MFDHQDRNTWLSANRITKLCPIIAPSILACDFARLLDECNDVLSDDGGAAEWLHVDVMDGHFVPNISIGMCVVDALRKHLKHAFLDVHCMVADPDRWVKDMAKAGASQLTFHVEAAVDAKAVARHIRAAGMQCGVALKPKTPATAVIELVEEKLVDMVLVMTVEPGFGGQSFMQEMMPKVSELRQAYPHLNIQVDGGLSEKTIDAAAEAGANVIVAGTSIFKAVSRKEATEVMRNTVKRNRTLRMQGNVFACLLDRLASVPHRSVTALSYGEWFSLYVQALKAAQKGVDTTRNNTQLHEAKCAVDMALLSSVVSQRWTDVSLPSGYGSTVTTAAEWCQKSTTLSTVAWHQPSSTIHKMEFVTKSFLVEPLSAGRAIGSWTAAVRQVSDVPSATEGDESIVFPTGLIVLPFTTLFQLRCEAHSRPQNIVTGKSEESQLQTTLSLQERGARVSVLQSLNHLMELQVSSKRRAHVEFAVWSPVNEFDAIMQLSRVRKNLPELKRPCFSLSHICEHETVRTAYLAHYLSLVTKGKSLTLLASQTQHATLRQLGLANSCVKSQSTLGNSERYHDGNSISQSLHQRAVKSCGKLVRRVITREENLRHVLVP